MGLSTSKQTVKRTDQRGRVTLVTMAEAIKKLTYLNPNIDIEKGLRSGNKLKTDFAYYEITDSNSK